MFFPTTQFVSHFMCPEPRISAIGDNHFQPIYLNILSTISVNNIITKLILMGYIINIRTEKSVSPR